MKKVDILGVKIYNLTMTEALDRIEEMILEGGKHQVVTANPEFLMLAQKDTDFRRILNQADLAIADGVGLLAAAKYLSMPVTTVPVLREFQKITQGIWVGVSVLFRRENLDAIVEQIAGADLIMNLAKLSDKKGYSFYLLGGAHRVAERTGEVFASSFPGLKVVGADDGGSIESNIEARAKEDQKIVDRINKTSPDILLVAFGAPKQEKWIARYLQQLRVKVAIGVGGTFDYMLKSPPRAPQILRSRGLEWLYRLVKEPGRFRRVFAAFPLFPLRVAYHRLKVV